MRSINQPREKIFNLTFKNFYDIILKKHFFIAAAFSVKKIQRFAENEDFITKSFSTQIMPITQERCQAKFYSLFPFRGLEKNENF